MTVFGCDPSSGAPAGGWDARAGFATEGEAARARREEDARACEALGATPVWLPFGSVDYERHGEEAEVERSVAQHCAGADLVLLPGAPLTHPDHAWLVDVILRGDLTRGRLGFYAEQPYTWRSRDPVSAGRLAAVLGAGVGFTPLRAGLRALLAKRRAILWYRSQLPLLALRGRTPLAVERLLLAEARAGGEAVAWATARPPLPQTRSVP